MEHACACAISFWRAFWRQTSKVMSAVSNRLSLTDLIRAISKRTELSLCFEPGNVLAHRLRCILAHLAENMSLVGRVDC